MSKNPYPEFIEDDVSGILVHNEKHLIFEEAQAARDREWLEFIKAIENPFPVSEFTLNDTQARRIIEQYLPSCGPIFGAFGRKVFEDFRKKLLNAILQSHIKTAEKLGESSAASLNARKPF